MGRSTEEVLRDHLDLAMRGDVETDFERNFADDLVIITAGGVFHGKSGARAEAEVLAKFLPEAVYRYLAVRVVDDVGFLTWTAKGRGVEVRDGTDTFVFRVGRIRVQTFHYTVLDEQGRVVGGE
jgi:hypothetical protein